MAKGEKAANLRKLAESLALFYPELAGQFICPTCLCTYPLAQSDTITVAHIIPRAADGSLFTYTCKKCNSTFGANQDKWFGEFLRLLKLENGSILHTKHQRGQFEIDGVRAGGTYQLTQERGFEVFIRVDRTSPEALRQIEEKHTRKKLDGDTKGRTHAMSFIIPLLENQDLITIGFLTSAYLMWFRELGYSWALRQHLSPIRDQIRNPSEAILPRSFLAPCRDRVFDRPWIGIGLVGKELALLAGLAHMTVFLPPADIDTREFYRILGTDLEGVEANYEVLHFYKRHAFGGPLGVVFSNRLVVVPDVMMNSPTVGSILFFPPDGRDPYLLYPMSQDEYERRREAGNVETIMLN